MVASSQARRRTVTVVAALLCTSVLSACGGGQTPARTAQTKTKPPAAGTKPASAPASAHLTPVSLRLSWLPEGHDAPFTLAKARGYYKAAGLDVTIEPGRGSGTTVQTVANGKDTFGAADAGTTALAVSQGVPVKMLSVYLQKTPFAFIYHGGTTFHTPADLKGKTLVDSAGDAALLMLPPVLKPYGLSKGQLRLRLTSPQSKVPVFLKDRQSIMIGFIDGDYPTALQQDPNLKAKAYSDFGVNLYNYGIITSLSEIRNHPGVVKAFMAATTKGWAYAAAHPQAAVQAEKSAYPSVDQAVVGNGFHTDLALLHTHATKSHVVGWMARSDWSKTIDLLHRYGGLKTVKPLTAYYTNRFLPAS